LPQAVVFGVQVIDPHKHLADSVRWRSSSREELDDRQDGSAETTAGGPSRGRNGRLVEWFGQWRKPIRGWLRTRASVPPGDIDDLAQEVFLRLLRYSDEVTVENPQGYLFRIAANVANEWRERSRVRKPHDDSWLEELRVESTEEPENALAKRRRATMTAGHSVAARE
jgi:DNA-directed RNA polymerase specialized sigma24 family protein